MRFSFLLLVLSFTAPASDFTTYIGDAFPYRPAAIATDAPGVVDIGSAFAALVILQRHRPNIRRVLAGTERRVGQRLYRLTD